jgi:hypothetical protein
MYEELKSVGSSTKSRVKSKRENQQSVPDKILTLITEQAEYVDCKGF